MISMLFEGNLCVCIKKIPTVYKLSLQKYDQEEKRGTPQRVMEWMNAVLQGQHDSCVSIISISDVYQCINNLNLWIIQFLYVGCSSTLTCIQIKESLSCTLKCVRSLVR